MKIDFFFLNFSIHPITAGERDDIKQYLFKKHILVSLPRKLHTDQANSFFGVVM